MSQTIELVIRAKNALAAGLGKAKDSINKFGESAAKIGANIAKSFLAIGAGVAAFAVKAISDYAEAEAAENSLSSALRVHGDEVESNMQKLKASASAIQNETAVGDENVLMRMSKLRMLGIESGLLDAAAKATIALKSAGMDEAAAIKAVAMANDGNYSALSRYIPALRSATSEAEKAAIVNQFLTDGYQQQKDSLNTVSGQWEVLKGRVGDAWEEIGKAISQNDGLMTSIKSAGDAVKAFGDRVSAWVSGGGVTTMIVAIRMFYESARESFQNVGSIAKVSFAVVSDTVSTVFQYLKNVVSAWVNTIVVQFGGVKDVIVATWEAVKNPSKAAFSAIGDAAKKAAQDVIKSSIDYGKALLGENSKVTSATEAALDERYQMLKENAEREIDVEKWAADKMAAAKIKTAEDTAKELINIADDTAAKQAAIAEQTAKDAANALADAQKRMQGIDQIAGTAARDKLKAEAQKLLDEAAELGKQRFTKDDVNAKKAELKAAPQKARDEAAMAAKLEKYRALQEKGWKGNREMDALLALDKKRLNDIDEKNKEAGRKEREANELRLKWEEMTKEVANQVAQQKLTNKKLDSFGAGD